MNYPVGDFLIQVKNAMLAKNHEVTVRGSKLINAVAKAMERLGYLEEVRSDKGNIIVKLTYRRKQPVLLDLKLVSKPGLRIYKSADDLEAIKSPSIVILSTPQGVLSQKEAIKKRVGGEAIVELW